MTTETLVIDLPTPTLAALRADAEAQGKDPARVAAEFLTQQYAADAHAASSKDMEEAEERNWWESLSETEKNQEIAALARSLAEADAGRTQSAEDVYARVRAVAANAASAGRGR